MRLHQVTGSSGLVGLAAVRVVDPQSEPIHHDSFRYFIFALSAASQILDVT